MGIRDVKMDAEFGRLKIIAYLGFSATAFSEPQDVWKLKCSCGEVIIRGARNLATKQIKSCGCLRREMGLAKLKKGKATQSRLARERRSKLPIERGVSDEMAENELVTRDSVSTGCAVRG